MTIHDEHPFLDPEPDQARRFRGRLGGAVTLWTAGEGRSRAGLTVSSVVVAGGEPPRVVGLVDPESEFREAVEDTGRAVVQLLRWPDRQLAEAFAGQFPAPGGPFTLGEWEQTPWGPRLRSATSYAAGRLVPPLDGAAALSLPVGWSDLLVLAVEAIVVGEDDQPLGHRRGRYRQP